jgi:hypothetical protein
MCLVVMYAINVLPRVVPMTQRACALQLHRWMLLSSNGDEQLQIMNYHGIVCGHMDDDNFGCVALQSASRVRAVALLEDLADEKNNVVRVMFVHSDDLESGTMLMRALTKTIDLKFSSSVNVRWRIAHAYFLSPSRTRRIEGE